MKVSELIKKIGYKNVTPAVADRELHGCFTSDLLSDVMGNGSEEDLLVTIQAHKNSVAVAMLKDSPLIILCSNRKAPADMIAAAEDEGIILAEAGDNQYVVSWKIHEILGV